jgi:hypothetical protein
MRKIALLAILSLVLILPVLAQQFGQKPPNPNAITLARLKYPGGGDWYWGNSALPNLIKFIKENTNINIADEEVVVSIMDETLFSYPFLFMTGHGNVKFSDQEVDRLRKFLTAGGFLFANDSYGMDQAFRREMKKVFPEEELVELPFNHGIYHSYYDFPNGLPKIHKHDGKPAQGFGIFYKERLVVFYAYESDIGDGWEDPQVHNDPPEKKLQALKMGVNILVWAVME